MSYQLAEKVLSEARARKILLATAESCTGGLIGGALTDVPGSSDVVERGFITYSNEAKTDLLGVKEETLKNFGAVSAETAREMAEGALRNSRADIAVSVTGIAGPGGGSAAKPVGLVYIGVASKKNGVRTIKNNFTGDRAGVRRATIEKALDEMLGEIISG